MKTPTTTVEVTSNMVFDETYKIGIADDDEAVTMIIERLISTYKNPYRAALREYTSNAWDEHVQSGTTRPVEVSLPSELSPVLKVQDFGRGLSREQLKGYGTIGKSSKRDSNDTTGGFGMGSKCALAASPQFTVVSVQNGIRNTVIVSRDEKNVPHMNFLPETETTDPSGTTIVIPINDVALFGDLTNFWIGWAPGTLLVNDDPPARTVYDHDRFRNIRDLGWYDLNNVPSGQNVLRVMINQVYYELAYRDMGLDYKQWNILKYYIIKLDNGSVGIAGSREDLLYDARTKAAIKERTNALLTLAAVEAAEAVEAAPDIKTALTLLVKMDADGYPTEGVRFQGKALTLPGTLYKGNLIPDPSGTWAEPHRDSNVKAGWRVDKEYRGLSAQKVWTFTPSHKFVIIHSAAAPSPYGKYGRRYAHKEAYGVGEYLSGQSLDVYDKYSFFVTEEPLKRINRHYRDMADIILSAEEFNAVVRAVRSAAAKEAKLVNDAKKANQKLRVVTFSSYNSTTYTEELTAERIKESYDHVIFLRNADGGMGARFRESLTTKVNRNVRWNERIKDITRKHNAVMILIGKNDKIDGLKAYFPSVVTIQELAIKTIEASAMTTTKYDRMAVRDREKYGATIFRRLKDEHLDKIKNKETVLWAKSIRDFVDTGAQVRSSFDWLAQYDQSVEEAIARATPSASAKALPESPLKRYPLLIHVDSYSTPPTDVVDYVNLREKALKKG